MMHLGIVENSTISILRRLQSLGFVRRRQELESASREHQRVALKAKSEAVSVGDLSGGNQQKVLLSKWLLVDPDVLFLDDPTRGIDIGAKRDIYQIIEDLAASGKGVILVSSELPELLLCCHRIMVMREGATTGIVESRSTTQEQIMQLATAGSQAG
jgi:ABC-type sugar transport system ATPase subunit